jgi:hypothetical protein
MSDGLRMILTQDVDYLRVQLLSLRLGAATAFYLASLINLFRHGHHRPSG